MLLTLEAEGGTEIREAITEAQRIATQLNIGVQFNFNGIEVIVTRNTNIDEKVKLFEKAIRSGSKITIV
jgi:hypothetical protein